jgi:hypothetical protein
MVEETSQRLRAAWDAKNAGKEWKADAELGKSDPLLFAVAEFERRPDLASRVLSRIA